MKLLAILMLLLSVNVFAQESAECNSAFGSGYDQHQAAEEYRIAVDKAFEEFKGAATSEQKCKIAKKAYGFSVLGFNNFKGAITDLKKAKAICIQSRTLNKIKFHLKEAEDGHSYLWQVKHDLEETQAEWECK